MRQRALDSTGSNYSSLFDTYSQEARDSYLSELSQESIIDFGKNIRQVSIAQLSPTDSATTYSHYEPVNNILSSLHSKKVTIKNLRQNDFEYDIKTLTYCEYWEINEEYYQVMSMLEPKLLEVQGSLFDFYQQIKRTNLELKLISRHYVPELMNLDLVQVNMEDRTTIYKSFCMLSNFFESLYCNVARLLENKIVVNSEVISRITGEAFACMDAASESFISGIVVLFDIYDQSLKEYFQKNGEKVFKQIGLDCDSNKITDLLPHALMARYHLKLCSFHSILLFEVVKVPMTKAIEHSQNIQARLDIEKRKNQKKARLTRQSRWLASSAAHIFLNFPSILFNACILLPFVVLCWLLFSIKALFPSHSNHGLLNR